MKDKGLVSLVLENQELLDNTDKFNFINLEAISSYAISMKGIRGNEVVIEDNGKRLSNKQLVNLLNEQQSIIDEQNQRRLGRPDHRCDLWRSYRIPLFGPNNERQRPHCVG